MKAMLLAAGLGTRMAPVNPHTAKPALPVLDVPVVARLLNSLAEQGVSSAVINAHAHADSLRDALRDAPIPVRVLVEPDLRGSGGGLLGARALLADAGAFLVVNADMCLDIDLRDLLASHQSSGALATLALRDDPRKQEFGTIGYDSRDRVCRITSRLDLGDEKGCGLFIGVQVMEPRIFERMPERQVFHLMPDVYVPALQDGEILHAWSHPREAAWWPVGSPLELLEANLAALDRLDGERYVAPDAHVAGELVGAVWIGAGARLEAGSRVGPRAVVSAGAVVAAGATLTSSLALPHALVARDATLSRAVAFADEFWRDD